MKKYVLCITVLLLVVAITGCKKKEIELVEDEITVNTMVIKKNSEIQVAILEDFNKDYYRISELSEYIEENVDAYNQKVGNEEIIINNVMKNDDGKAMMILNYSGMAHYSAFNDVIAASFSATAQNITIELPDQLLSVKDNTPVDIKSALDSKKYRVIVLHEPYEIIVNGDIKYYSENLLPVDDNTVRDKYFDEADENAINKNEATVVVYKPF